MGYLLQTLIMIVFIELLLLGTLYISRKLDHLLTVILSVVFLLIITFRPFSVPDTIAYYDFYNQLEFYKFVFRFGRTYLGFENGFCNLSKLIYLIYPNFRFFLFVIGSISFLLIFTALLKINKLFNQECNLWFPLFALYVPYFGLMYSGIVLRAGIAIGFCLYSFYYIQKKNIIKSIILFGFGLWFHNSAFIFIIVLLLYYIPLKLSNKQIYKLSIAIFVLYFMRAFDLLLKITLSVFNFLTKNISFLNFISHYVDNPIDTTFRWAIVFNLLLFVFISYVYSQSNLKSIIKYENILLPLMVIIALFGGFPVILRVSDYFMVLSFVLLFQFFCGNNRKGVVAERIVIFSSHDRLFLSILNILLSVIFYLLFLRTASFI